MTRTSSRTVLRRDTSIWASTLGVVSRHIWSVVAAISSVKKFASMASLFGKYWYREPMVTPATSAIRLVVSRSTPSSARTCLQAWIMASTTTLERLWLGRLRGSGGSFFMAVGPAVTDVSSGMIVPNRQQRPELYTQSLTLFGATANPLFERKHESCHHPAAFLGRNGTPQGYCQHVWRRQTRVVAATANT